MEWFAFIFAIAALAVASDSEARAARLARRVANLEKQLQGNASGEKGD